MLTRFIVASYAGLVELALWVAVIAAAIVGYHIALPVALWMEAVPKNAFAWQLLGASALSVSTVLLLAVITGPFLLIVEIRRSVRAIETRLTRRREPVQSLASQRWGSSR